MPSIYLIAHPVLNMKCAIKIKVFKWKIGCYIARECREIILNVVISNFVCSPTSTIDYIVNSNSDSDRRAYWSSLRPIELFGLFCLSSCFRIVWFQVVIYGAYTILYVGNGPGGRGGCSSRYEIVVVDLTYTSYYNYMYGDKENQNYIPSGGKWIFCMCIYSNHLAQLKQFFGFI